MDIYSFSNLEQPMKTLPYEHSLNYTKSPLAKGQNLPKWASYLQSVCLWALVGVPSIYPTNCKKQPTLGHRFKRQPSQCLTKE